jgi:hypothetical protein
MKLIEYLAPLAQASQQVRILVAMYYLGQTEGKTTFTVADIRAALVSARIAGLKSWNFTARLTSAGAYVHSSGVPSSRTWELTDTGRDYVAGLVQPLPATKLSKAKQDDMTSLRGQVASIADPEARAFASEAVDCLEIGAHRAAIVFMWVAAVHELQERIWATSTRAAITAAAQSHNQRAKVSQKRDDLSEYNEDLLLQVAQDLAVIDKNQKIELKRALDLRNGSGHPNKLRPGEQKAKAHIEDIITMLF